jgi:dTDP-4-amino-4,6-dideoxygalactose transaminase
MEKENFKYDNVCIGYNSKLDTIQTAILNVKFKPFVKIELSDVQKVYQLYDQLLVGRLITKPIIPEGYLSSFAQYTIKLKDNNQRDKVQKHLKDNKVPTFIYYLKAMHQQKAMSIYQHNEEELKNSTMLSERVLSLTMHPYLRRDDISKISKSINSFLVNYN